MSITVVPIEIDAPVALESPAVEAPLSVSPVEIEAPISVEAPAISAPVSLETIEITAPVTIGGGGGAAADFYEAAATLAGHRAVAFDSSGRVIYADASLGVRSAGVIRDAVVAGETVRVYHGGRVTGFSGLAVGETYWLRDSGQLSLTPPSSGILQQVGFPASSTTFLVEVSEPTQLN